MVAAAPWPPPAQVSVHVEVPCGSLVKWDSGGGVDFLSPVPCPFAYGSVDGLAGQDGDPLDALVLGGDSLARGQAVTCRVAGRVRFIDAGDRDDKWICLPVGRSAGPTRRELRRVRVFFSVYARVKGGWHRLRGARGPTRVEAVELLG